MMHGQRNIKLGLNKVRTYAGFIYWRVIHSYMQSCITN